MTSTDAQNRIVQRLCDALARETGDATARVIETHISFVILAGRFAYKIKKAVDLGFLDYSTLARRRHFCLEELRLNRRLARALYRDVVTVRGSMEQPHLGGHGAILEYAVRMARFPDDEQLDRVLAAGRLDATHVDHIAAQVAGFHGRAPCVPPESPHGRLAEVRAPMLQNFQQLAPCVPRALPAARLTALQDWTVSTLVSLRGTIAARRRNGHVRECHGDLHLANMAWHDGELVVFDCIEFSDALRCIDTASDLAFLLMDLDHRGHPRYAARLLNAYLAASGDYGTLAVLDLYRVYRALVRAKVACIRAGQSAPGEGTRALADVRALADLALGYVQRPAPALFLTTGVSGSGKSWLAGQLAERLPAVWLRSDVERKRLAGLPSDSRSGSGVGRGIYAERMSQRTYGNLRKLAQRILASGHSVLVDATFLRHRDRAAFAELAAQAGCPLHLLALDAPERVLYERVRARALAATDPSEATTAVLDQQLAAREPLTHAERARATPVDTSRPVDIERLVARLRPRALRRR